MENPLKREAIIHCDSWSRSIFKVYFNRNLVKELQGCSYDKAVTACQAYLEGSLNAPESFLLIMSVEETCIDTGNNKA